MPHHMTDMDQTVSLAEMDALANRVIATLPDPFRSHCANIVLQVEDFADSDQLSSLGLDDRWELSGLYEGRPLPDLSIWQTGEMPPRIWLFRKPLVAEMRSTGIPLKVLVRHVVVHEVGHHFGFTDAEMHALEAQADYV